MIKKRLLVTFVAAALSAGCANLPRAQIKGNIAPPKEIKVEPSQAVGADEDTGMEIESSFEDIFLIKPLSKSDALPNYQVSNLSFDGSTAVDAVRLLARNANLSLSFHNSGNSSIYGTVTAYDVSGPLPAVMEGLSQSAGFYYNFHDGVLHITPDEQFVVNLPPIINDDVFAGMANTITKLGGFDTYLDRQGRSLVFRANRPASEAIGRYLERVRETRSVIVYDTYVYQVELSDSNQTGINWGNLALAVPLAGGNLTAGLASVGGGAALTDSNAGGFNAVYSGKRFNMTSLFSFLKTQGTVKTVAQPKLAILSGANGTFRVGDTTNYVSKIGSVVSTGTTQTTVETSKIESGLDIGLSGDIHDGTIYTRVSMSLTDLLRFNVFQTLGTQLNLPQTANREINTTVRSKPGDLVMLGGINNSNDTHDVNGIPLTKSGDNGLLTSKNISAKRSELVIVMKPKVISFVNKKGAE